jgi:hypothetical protein
VCSLNRGSRRRRSEIIEASDIDYGIAIKLDYLSLAPVVRRVGAYEVASAWTSGVEASSE